MTVPSGICPMELLQTDANSISAGLAEFLQLAETANH
jgi:hypothetical protein